MSSQSQSTSTQQVELPTPRFIVRDSDDLDEGKQLRPEEQELKNQRDPDETAEDDECDVVGPVDAGEADPLRKNSRMKSPPKATARLPSVLDWCWKAAVFILLLIIAAIIALRYAKTWHAETAAAATNAVDVHSTSGPATSSVGNAAPTAGPTAATESKLPEITGFKMVKFMLNSSSLPICQTSDSSKYRPDCRDRIWMKVVLASGTPKELGPLWCLSRNYSFATDEGSCDDKDAFYRLTATGIEIRQTGRCHVTVQITAHREKMFPADVTKSDDQSPAAKKPVAVSLRVNGKMEVSQTTRSIDPSSPDDGDVTASLSAWLWLSAGDVISVMLELPLGQSLLGLKISTKAAETFVQLVKL